MSKIRIGTRGSKLALAQTEKVIGLLAENGIEAEYVIIKTTGDNITDRGLHQIGGFGMFVRELDNAILRGEIDCAVHSMKDIPAERPKGLLTVAVLKRDPPYDYLVMDGTMEDLTVIGTSSLRRKAQLLRYYNNCPGIRVEMLRGNLDTRLAKLDDGLYDGIVVAEAGLKRLDYRRNGIRMPVDMFVPAANQGTVAVVSRDTPELRAAFAQLNDHQSALDCAIERIVMEEVGGGCFTPMGIFCENRHLIAEVLSLDGTRAERITADVVDLEGAKIAGIKLRTVAAELIAEAKLALGEQTGKPGKVYLVGSGPGGLGLLTFRAREVIDSADVIMYDQLPGDEIIASLPARAEKIDVGKYGGHHTMKQEDIEKLLVEKAQAGGIIVRLKGGDPFLFGRGGEEMEVLREHNIPCEAIPGVTSGIAVPECVGIPVTHRDFASQVTFVTGHENPEKEVSSIDWKWLAGSPGTIVIYMGVKNLGRIAELLIENGRDPKTKIAVIERGFRPDQRVTCATLVDIGEVSARVGLKPPAIIVIGEVVGLYRED
ncbi:Porphobilinogen deaminase [bioreactor metagenome]|uniref:uroporphyrinogen-III C-methyltransferase n=1 Tax=bioreactor metagenome TaxID=1076179 RepID=A0A644V746_9ZZZZ|nr:uroporphyrinogen-III C-methyltransferase [Methanocorpusculum sp.]